MNTFHPITLPNPFDLIIEQILDLFRDGELKHGKQLPAEPILQQGFRVSKQQLKAAFSRLETYGVVETRPQAGVYINNFVTEIRIALIDNILNMGKFSDPYAFISKAHQNRIAQKELFS